MQKSAPVGGDPTCLSKCFLDETCSPSASLLAHLTPHGCSQTCGAATVVRVTPCSRAGAAGGGGWLGPALCLPGRPRPLST